jgi:tetratricopeptide (TPR) repeat protein
MKKTSKENTPSSDEKFREKIHVEILKLDAESKGLQGADQLKIGEKIRALAEKISDKNWMAKGYRAIGNSYGKLSQHEKSIKPFTEAIRIYSELEDAINIVRCRSTLENTLSWLGKTEEVYASRIETLALARETGDPEITALALIRIANDTLFLGNSAKALTFIQEALGIATTFNLSRITQNCHLGLSEIAIYNNDLNEGLFHAEEALRVGADEVDLSWKTRLFGQVAKALNSKGRHNDSIISGEKALKLAEEAGSWDGQSLAHRYLSEAYRNLKKFDLAEKHGIAAVQFARKSKNTRFIGGALIYLGRIKEDKQEYEQAIKYFQGGAKFGKSLNADELACVANERISAIYEHHNDYKKALEYFKIHKIEHEKHEREETRLKLKAYEIDMEVEKKHKEAEFANFRIEHLEKELISRAQSYASQTELLATFREDLRRIIRKIEVRDPAINELIAKLRELPEAVNWKEFEEQFRQVHPEFKINLKKKFPELSEDELQVAALFRLKLKSPDIGKLLSLSYRTVQNRRNRIRKKLGLKSDDDIAKFLGGF